MKQEKRAALKLGAAMIIFGTISIFVKNIELPSAELALGRAVLAAMMLGAYLLAGQLAEGRKKKSVHSGESICGGNGEAKWLFLSGAAMGVNWILLFEAYKYTTVSNATLSYYFAPILVTVICPFLFHEKMTLKQGICFAMATIGMFLIIGSSGLKGTGDIHGILLGLGAACFYATVILLNKFIRNVSGLNRTFFQFLAAIVVLLPYVLLRGGLHFGTLSPAGWKNLLIVGLFHTGFTYCLYFTALKDLPGQKAAILSYIDPLVAVVVSVLILGESITPIQILGGALILGFALLNEKGD